MDSSSRHRATRRRSPPERVVTSASPGGRRRASMAISVVRDRSQAPAASIFDQVGLAGAQLLVVGVGIGPAGHDLVVLGQQGSHLADPVHDVALHVLGRVELRLLLQHPHAEPGREPGLAVEAVVDAGHDPQQRRLARPVGAQHPDLGPRVERQRDVLEDLLVGRVEPAHLAHGEDELRAHGGGPYRLPGHSPNLGWALSAAAGP